MRYDLGLMDMYPFEVSGTCIENDPMFRITMKKKIDAVKLEDAVNRAIKFHPLFGTQVRYDKVYYLQTNNRPVKLVHAEERKRPLEFCSTTNGYPWQMCYYDRTVTLEWCHGVTDGRGALNFLKTVLSIYCGERFPVVPRKIMLGPGLEPFVDYKEKGKEYEVDPEGFSAGSLPSIKRGFRTDAHILSADTAELLEVSKKNGGSPSTVLAALISKAIRKHLPKNAKNRNVACNVVMDLRRSLDYETMHNCSDFKRLTYQDVHDSMGFAGVCREYKDKLDHARVHENIVRLISDRIKFFKTIMFIKSKAVRHGALKLVGKVMRDSDCNVVVTYLGKTDFSPKVNAEIEDITFRVWHDFGECILAAVDFNGTFRINICENFVEKGIVEDFIALSAEQGIHWNYIESCEYEQGHFTVEGSVKSRAKERTSEERAPREQRSPVPAGSPAIFL